MANTIVGNVYIVDTGSGNTSLIWPTKARIEGVGAWFSGGAGEVQFSGADTSQIVIRLAATLSGNNASTNYIYLGGINFQEMKVPVLTSGTAWIYFS